MITSYGFNGFLKNNINLNLLFKSHDSGYYSFSTSSATSSNNYPVENKSGFCQIKVEEKGTMAAQYIFYYDNTSYFRIGDVSGITIRWAQWNRMLGEEALTTRYTLDDLSKLFFSYDRSYFNINKYYGAPNTGSDRYWKSTLNGNFYTGYEDQVYEFKGEVPLSFDIIANTAFTGGTAINGWYYLPSTYSSSQLPYTVGRGILKVFTSNVQLSNNAQGTTIDGMRTFVYIDDAGRYFVGRLNKNETNIRWAQLVVASDFTNNMNQYVNTIDSILATDVVADLRLSTPSYSDWEGITTNDITKHWGSTWVLANTAINASLYGKNTLDTGSYYAPGTQFVWQFVTWYRKPQMLRNGGWYDIPVM